jgi:hypothetical protein
MKAPGAARADDDPLPHWVWALISARLLHIGLISFPRTTGPARSGTDGYPGGGITGGQHTRSRELKRNPDRGADQPLHQAGVDQMADACGVSYDVLAWTSE